MRSFASHLSAKLAQHRPSAVLSASVGTIQVMSERVLAAAATRISTLRIAKQRSFKVSTKCRGFQCVMLFRFEIASAREPAGRPPCRNMFHGMLPKYFISHCEVFPLRWHDKPQVAWAVENGNAM
jgi:hypothetical protein